ncbi:MAG: hypothetical protein R3F65_30055 [bacterium]
MSIIRRVEYPVRVTGADRAARDLDELDRAADGAATGLDRSGDAAREAAREYAAAEGKARRLGAEVKTSGGAVERFERRMGSLSKIVGGFGLMALPGAIMGVVELTKSVWGWTEAGKEATRVQEAQAAAVAATVERLVAMEAMITSVSSADLVAYTRAEREQTRIKAALTEAIEAQLEAEDKLRRGRAASSRSLMKEASEELAAATGRVDALREAYARVNTVVRDFDDRRVMESAEAARARIAEAAKTADAAATAREKAADAAARAAEKRARETQRSIAEGVKTSMAAMDAFVEQSGPETDAADVRERLRQQHELAEAHREVSEEIKRAAAEAARAWEAPMRAVADLGRGLAQAAVAAIFSGIAALAQGTWPPNPVALAAAGEHFTSAAVFAGIAAVSGLAGAAMGGGGGGVGEPSPAAQAAPAGDGTVAAGDRTRGGGATVVNLNLAGQPFETRSDIHDAIVTGIDIASRRRGRPRANVAAIQRRGRR